MELKNKNVIITGGCNGIGKELVKQFLANGARIVVADISKKINKIEKKENLLGVVCDVTDEKNIIKLVRTAEDFFGHIDMFVSNAGFMKGEKTSASSASNNLWQSYWDTHVMSHVFASRATLPSMIERKKGYFLQISSAAALLTQIGDAAYSASKSASLSFAESLAISHLDDGIKVSVVCPQYVNTRMINNEEKIQNNDLIKTTSEVVESIIKGIKDESFLILTHDKVHQYINYKINNYDTWIKKMSKIRKRAIKKRGHIDVKNFYKFL